MAKNKFNLVFNQFYAGASPAAHLNSLTELGSSGHYSSATNVDVLDPTGITQGPGLANLTAGTQAGAVTELIAFIMDNAVASDATYGIGPTKLFKISSTAVTNAGDFPHAITNCAEGESIVNMGGKLYYFFNKAAAGEIGTFDLTNVFDDDWGSTVPTGAAALQLAPHPSATKEDIICFGNGRYLGVYIGDTTTLYPTKVDFKVGCQVDDVVFHAGQWWVAVNSNITGTNRSKGEIYLYDGGAISTILNDETGVGVQRIGWLYVLNGIIYVAYQDLSSSGGFKIGYISGRQLKELASFTGTLPTFQQKTLYKNTILFVSNGLIYSIGAVTPDLPVQISQIADGGYATVGALAAPFGTPMVASYDGATNYKLAKFSGYDTNSNWRSIVIPLMQGNAKGYIDEVVVLTNSMGANARCDLTIEVNQATTTSSSFQITTAAKRRHLFYTTSLLPCEDMRIVLSWANGSASNPVQIREIQVNGHFVNC